MTVENIISKVPLKNKKSHCKVIKFLGYSCPICNGTGYSVKPSCLYGGTACHFCEFGIIKNKKKWIYLKAKKVVEKYKKYGR